MGHATMLYPTTWLRGRTYWPRRVVPLDLRDRLGGLTEVRHSRWKIESIKVDRLFEQARRGGAVMPTGLRRITEDERDYYFDKLVADDQRERRLPDHVRRRYMAYMQDDGSRRCSEVLERWVRERQPPLKTEAERRKNFTRFIAIGRPEQPHSPSHACACSTFKKIITAVKSVFSWAVNNGHIEGVNPVQGITVANVTDRGSSAPPVR